MPKTNQIGDFILEKPLKFGRWTEIWRARWLRAPAPQYEMVALKILRIEFVLDPIKIERFNNEIRAMSSLQHPHIAPPVAWGLFDDGRRYFASQFIEGQPLSNWINGKPLPSDFVLSVLTMIASAVHYIHSQRVVHRDIKPDNILITAQGVAYLVDFSVALSKEAVRVTLTGELVGTVAYMAPEIILGQSITPWSDIYSLGVVAYELLTGRHPFEGNQLEVTYKHVNVAVPPASSINRALSSTVDDCLAWALAKDPKQRPRSATLFVQSLQKSLEEDSYVTSEGQVFGKVWYTNKSYRFYERRDPDSGTLVIGETSARFTSQEQTIIIENVRDAQLTRMGADLRPAWVKVEYGDFLEPAVAWFSDAKRFGLIGLTEGRSRQILSAFSRLIARAPTDVVDIKSSVQQEQVDSIHREAQSSPTSSNSVEGPSNNTLFVSTPPPAARSIESSVSDNISMPSPENQAMIPYYIQISASSYLVPVGAKLEVIIELNSAMFAENADYLLNIPKNEVEGSELNLTLDAPGFQFLEEPAASLPLMEPSRYSAPQKAIFRLVALRPGSAQISAELYIRGEYEGKITQTVNVAGIEENVTLSRSLVLSPRPVAQPDYVLQVQTRWDEGGSACSFHYHLASTHASLLLTGGVRAQSKSLSTVQVERLRDSWQLLLGEMASGVAIDVRSRLAAFGRYLYKTLLPDTLRQELRMLGGVRRVAQSKGRTLLLVADEDAWLPWELLYDDKRRRFLGERVIVGRWLRELGEVPPYEFPVGQVRVAYYERVAEEYEWWVGLIEPPGSPRAEALPGGVLENPIETEGLRGLHLLRYDEKMGEGDWSFDRLRNHLPVLFADADKEETISGQVQPIKLNLYRNRPLVSLSYVTSGAPELTNLIEQWAPTFVRAGCSAFVGPLWTVSPAVEAAFISGFYHHLWTGGSLGEAFEAGRQLARAANPESLDWLAYVLFGDPMARPYRPVKGMGYAVVEPIGQSIDEPLRAGVRTRFRVGLRRTPPVWLKERVIEVEEALEFKEPRVHLVAFDLPVEPKGAIELVRTAQGEYLGWFSVRVPPDMVDEVVELQVHFADGRKRIQSVMLSFDVIDGKTEEGS